MAPDWTTLCCQIKYTTHAAKQNVQQQESPQHWTTGVLKTTVSNDFQWLFFMLLEAACMLGQAAFACPRFAFAPSQTYKSKHRLHLLTVGASTAGVVTCGLSAKGRLHLVAHSLG